MNDDSAAQVCRVGEAGKEAVVGAGLVGEGSGWPMVCEMHIGWACQGVEKWTRLALMSVISGRRYCRCCYRLFMFFPSSS